MQGILVNRVTEFIKYCSWFTIHLWSISLSRVAVSSGGKTRYAIRNSILTDRGRYTILDICFSWVSLTVILTPLTTDTSSVALFQWSFYTPIEPAMLNFTNVLWTVFTWIFYSVFLPHVLWYCSFTDVWVKCDFYMSIKYIYTYDI